MSEIKTVVVPESLKVACLAFRLDPEDTTLLPPSRVVELVSRVDGLSDVERDELVAWLELQVELQVEAQLVLDALPMFEPRDAPPAWFGEPWVLALQCPWSCELKAAVEAGLAWLGDNQ